MRWRMFQSYADRHDEHREQLLKEKEEVKEALKDRLERLEERVSKVG